MARGGLLRWNEYTGILQVYGILTKKKRHTISPANNHAPPSKITQKPPKIPPALGTVSTFWGTGSGFASVFGYPVGLDSSFTGGIGAGAIFCAGWGTKFSGTTPPFRAISTLRVMNLETSQVRRESTWRFFGFKNGKGRREQGTIFWMIEDSRFFFLVMFDFEVKEGSFFFHFWWGPWWQLMLMCAEIPFHLPPGHTHLTQGLPHEFCESCIALKHGDKALKSILAQLVVPGWCWGEELSGSCQ